MKKKNFADSIVEEGLQEAADNFFGRRVSLEGDIDLLKAKAEDLRSKLREVHAWQGNLHILLGGDEQHVHSFYNALGVDSPALDDLHLEDAVLEHIVLHRGLTLGGRYFNTVFGVYARLYDLTDAYLHGRYLKQQDNRRILSINYRLLERFTDEVNQRIRTMNSYSKPSDMLQFTKKLDTITQDKERLTDSGIQYTLDDEMAFEPISLASLGLEKISELPSPNDAASRIKAFCRDAAKNRSEQIQSILQDIKAKKKGQ
ncbi:MAG: hypothetical protein ACOC24_03195 [Desulfovibrionales bacterium]